VFVLLREGQDPNTLQSQDDGSAALHVAASNGNIEIVEMLLAGGADPNLQNLVSCFRSFPSSCDNPI
jgi:ankyrin repeat protein